jgi:hypothetical protein
MRTGLILTIFCLILVLFCVYSACPPSLFDCNGDGICESSEPCDSNVNSIIEFELIVENDLVYSNVQCTINRNADLNIYFEDVLIFSRTIPCEENLTESLIGPIDFNEGVNKGVLKINTPCNVCEKVDYFAIAFDKNFKIPDNNFLGLFIILVSVLFIFTLKNKNVN